MFENQYFHLGQSVLTVLRAANEMDSTLLITGNTGTGKSHLAYMAHRAASKRAGGRWFKVNLATLSENLIESELFGHERGAFTGADARRVGRLEACNGGTVFLDEIGELPLRLQAKLLDFIQYKRITPVGSNREIELDVRIIAATNRNLETAVKAGEFRQDLYHRLNIFHVRLPDLAVTPKAVLGFAREFLANRAKAVGKEFGGFSSEVEQVFRHYGWPGNIRELENTIEYVVAMQDEGVVRLESLPIHLREYARDNLKLESTGLDAGAESVSGPGTTEGLPRTGASTLAPNAFGLLELPLTMDFHECKDVFEKSYLEQVLRVCGGQINLTSRRIGLNKVSLTDKIRRHGIDWRRIRHEAFGPSLPQAGAAAAVAS